MLGLGAIVFGIWMFCIPAAVIVAGIGLVLIGAAIDPPGRIPKPPKESEQ